MSLSIKHINPPQGLEKAILHLIYKKERFSMVLQSGLSVLSFVAFFPLGAILIENFTKSSFSDYLSILFSGDGTLTTYWQELTLSIIESLPILSITIFLGVGIFFLYSLNKAIKNGKQFLSLKIIA